MDLASLRIFVKVAEIGNISQSAAALGLTQPSISRVIASLEKDLGGPLFHRTGRGVSLTEIGEATLPRARSILGNSDQLVSDMRDLVKSPSGMVVIAMLPSLMEAHGGDLFDRIRQQFPGVRLRFLEGFSSQIEEWLTDGRADLGLVSRYHNRINDNEEIMSRSRLMLVGSSKWPSKAQSISVREIADLPLVLPAAPNGLRMAVEDAARRWQVSLRVIVEADSLLAQKEFVLRQGCYAVLSAKTIAREVQEGLFHAQALVNPALPRLVVMLPTKQRPMSRAAREVARVLRELAGE